MKNLSKIFALLLTLTVLSGATVAATNASDFTDISEEDSFYTAVEWATADGITYGVSDDLFDPQGEVTRAQVVTFLWRMKGSPEIESKGTFSDVSEGSWYETPVAWAVESGITAGTGDGMFSPDMVCDRAMCISLLYRLMDCPLDGIDPTASFELTEDMTEEDFSVYLVKELIKAIKENNIFQDVEEKSYYELPIYWAILNGVITEDNIGTIEEGVLFRPYDACLRKDMISFLYYTHILIGTVKAPFTYEFGPLTLPIPQEYHDLLYYEVYGLDDADESGETPIIIISERKSIEASEAISEDYIEGAGELVSIYRISKDRLHELLQGDMSDMKVFAKDETGAYFMLRYPTDAQIIRESSGEMSSDMDKWSDLNRWAREDLPEEILHYSPSLTEASYTNTTLDIYLAKIAYGKNVNYKLSTTEFGSLDPKGVDATPYIEYLLSGNFAIEERDEAPDGEYIVLNFPRDGVRYDFFTADKDLVREVRSDGKIFYRRVIYDNETNTDTMQAWYYAVAEKNGKKVSE